MDPDTEIQFDFFPFLRLYKSGRIERLLGTDVVPASIDPVTGVASKDVTIDSSTGVSARLYLPTSTTNNKKLPILVYIHGGGFVIESAFSPTYHNYLNVLVARADLLAVSVEYRRAPEHPLPAAYDDAWAAANWVASHAAAAAGGPEPWLSEHGDFDRVFLAGDSAGANIAHHVAVRTGAEELGRGMRIKGMVLIHPYFRGKEPVGTESSDPSVREKMESTWTFVCGGKKGLEDPLVDPLTGQGMERLACDRVLVTVAERDFLRERGKAYYEGLKASAWAGEVELMESDGEDHVFHLRNPTGEKALKDMERMISFFNRN